MCESLLKFCSGRKLKFFEIEEITQIKQAIYLCVRMLYICIKEPATAVGTSNRDVLFGSWYDED